MTYRLGPGQRSGGFDKLGELRKGFRKHSWPERWLIRSVDVFCLPATNSKGDGLMKSLSRRLLFGLPVPFFLTGGQSQAASLPRLRPTVTAEEWIRTELYFGTAMP